MAWIPFYVVGFCFSSLFNGALSQGVGVGFVVGFVSGWQWEGEGVGGSQND